MGADGRPVVEQFQSTHPAWCGTSRAAQLVQQYRISIHPPRVGWDCTMLLFMACTSSFQSTHPAWGGTQKCSVLLYRAFLFQSTHPAWGGTLVASSRVRPSEFQSTHPAWGGTLTRIFGSFRFLISIHPPRVGWDYAQAMMKKYEEISIHPPRVGWDNSWKGCWEV